MKVAKLSFESKLGSFKSRDISLFPDWESNLMFYTNIDIYIDIMLIITALCKTIMLYKCSIVIE